MKIKVQRRLQTLYYSPHLPTGFTGSLEQISKSIKKETAEKWLTQQPSWSRHRPVINRYRRRRIVSLGVNHVWSVDLMDMVKLKRHNHGIGYVLVVIDIFSKRVDCRPLKNKLATTVAEAFRDILQNGPTWFGGAQPVALRTDSGGEFKGVFKRFLTERGITHYVAGDPLIKASVVERVIQTLKRRMYRYLTHKNTKRYVDVLPQIVQSYNNRYHTSIKMRPNDVTLENQDTVRYNLYGTRDAAKLVQTVPKQLDPNVKLRTSPKVFPVGAHVRITKHKAVVGKHGYSPNFTTEIFRVLRRDPPTEPEDIKHGRRILYTLIDQYNQVITGARFYAEELSLAAPLK